MSQAQKGDRVKIKFTGKLEDGTVFANNPDNEPLELMIGEGKIIPGVETAVEGMNVGESKTVTVGPDQAFGARREELVETVGKDQFPPDVEVQAGQRFEIPQPQGGNPAVFTVVDVQGDQVTLDGNHPLAGRNLTFDLELVEIAGSDG